MSFVATFNAFQISGISKAEQHVLTAICTFANKNGICWPTTETIAARCLSSVRTVQTHINSLVSKGLIERIHRKGRPTTTKVLVPQTLTPTPADSAPPPPQLLRGEPVIEPVNTKTAAATSPPPETAIAAIVVSEIPEQPEQPDTTMLALEVVPAADVHTPLLNAPVPTAHEIVAVEPVSAKVIEENPLAGVPETLLQDLGEVRKAKKKPAKPTKTEANLWWAEAQKAGWSMEQVVLTMVLRGWSRFDASWVEHVPQQAVVQGREAVFKPEVVQPASHGAIAKFKEAWARQRAQMLADAAQRKMDRLRH